MVILIVIPVLNRPHRVQPLVENIYRSRRHLELHPVFVLSPDDHEELEEVENSGEDYIVCDWQPERGDFARKTNLAANSFDDEWILAGADDLYFQPGWAEAAVSVATKTKKRFVSTNDRANPLVMRGDHATHPLVHRSYLQEGTIDEPNKIYFEGYSHQCVDNEATATAKYRNEYVFAQSSVVEHHHPIYPRRGVRVPLDSTYEKGLRDGKEDLALFKSRQHLWMHRSR
jgi:hypothetical protein